MVSLLDQHAPAGTPYAQVGTILVRNCIHPRMTHLMRTVYHEDPQEALVDADAELIAMLRTLWRWEAKLTSYQILHVAMNLRDGGAVLGPWLPWPPWHTWLAGPLQAPMLKKPCPRQGVGS